MGEVDDEVHGHLVAGAVGDAAQLALAETVAYIVDAAGEPPDPRPVRVNAGARRQVVEEHGVGVALGPPHVGEDAGALPERVGHAGCDVAGVVVEGGEVGDVPATPRAVAAGR